MAVSIWEGKKAEELIEAVRGSGKVDKQQGTGNAGKALLIGDDGFVYPGEIETISGTISNALLNCFMHVAWVDEHGQEYYNALKEALYGIRSISAVYTQTGTVDVSDALDSLKENLVVTITKRDSTQTIIPADGYQLEGTLIKGISTITVMYNSLTTTFDVNVTDKRIVFEMEPEKIFDKSSVINTGVALPANNEDFTIIMTAKLDARASTATNDAQRYLIGWGGLSNDTQAVMRIGLDYFTDGVEDGKCHFVNNYITPDPYVNDSYNANEEHELICVVRNKNAVYTKIFYCDGTRIQNTQTNIASLTRAQGGNLAAGGKSTSGDAKTRFKGTVHMMNIYNTALENAEIENILGMSLS